MLTSTTPDTNVGLLAYWHAIQAEEIQEQGTIQPRDNEGAGAGQQRAARANAARPRRAASAPENDASGDANESTARTITDAIIIGMNAAFQLDQVEIPLCLYAKPEVAAVFQLVFMF